MAQQVDAALAAEMLAFWGKSETPAGKTPLQAQDVLDAELAAYFGYEPVKRESRPPAGKTPAEMVAEHYGGKPDDLKPPALIPGGFRVLTAGEKEALLALATATTGKSCPAFGETSRATASEMELPVPASGASFFARAMAHGQQCGFLTIPNEAGELIEVPASKPNGAS